MKLKLFREKVDNTFSEGMMNYGRLAQKDEDKALEGMTKVAKHTLQAATELVRRKHEMTFIHGAALATSSAWETVYSDYEALAIAEAAAMEADLGGMTGEWDRVRELVRKVKKSIRKAQKEEKKLLKRLKLTGDEVRTILDNAWVYVNKCETVPSQPGLVANILIRKLSMLR